MIRENWKILLSSLFSLLFVAVNLLFISSGNYYFFVFPFVFIAFLLLVFAQEYAYWAVLFLTPLSVNLDVLELGSDIALPTEPLLFALLVFFLLKLFRKGKADTFMLKHPISLAIFFYLFWMLVTSITSEEPLVSFKFLLAHLWFILPLYFMAYPLYKKTKHINRFFWLSLFSLSLVVIYTTLMHASYGFSEDVGRWVMSPFYNDHTAYGMILAFSLPILLGFVFWPKNSPPLRLFSAALSVLFLFAFYLSYSRAAWLSLLVAGVVYGFMKFKVGFVYLLLFSIFVLAFVVLNQDQIRARLEMNNVQSSSNFVEHVESSSNIASDASNLERINRWNCALRLFEKRKFVGWGPGTYQFVYGPMQRSDERTIISTNSGDAGTAHSEYLGPLAESGFFGFMAILAVFLSMMATGFKVYRKSKSSELKHLALVITLALSTYLSHAFLNNFLDTDKAAVPFWTLAAILLALDWKSQQEEQSD